MLEGLVSGIIGTLIGALGTFMMLRFHYQELYAKTISESRNRWIDLFRENISVMLAEAEMCLKNKDNHNVKYSKAKNRILIRMNENEPEHNLLQASIMRLDNILDNKIIEEKDRDQFVKLRELILIQTRHILKTEWERVKDEACGRR